MTLVRHLRLLVLALCGGLPAIALGQGASSQPTDRVPPRSLAICYNVRVPAASFQPFDLLVLDSAHPPAQVRELRSQGKEVLGYLSLGAVDPVRSWFRPLEEARALRGPNGDFGSQKIDVTNPLWATLVVDKIVPELDRLGFQGVFLDDLDLLYQEKQHATAVKLIADIRRKYPRIRLMANRGLEYLTRFAPHIDYVLLESCVATDKGIRPAGDLAWALKHLRSGQETNPKLIGCAVDYYAKQSVAPPPPAEFVAAVRERYRQHALIGCITTQDLRVAPLPPNKD